MDSNNLTLLEVTAQLCAFFSVFMSFNPLNPERLSLYG